MSVTGHFLTFWKVIQQKHGSYTANGKFNCSLADDPTTINQVLVSAQEQCLAACFSITHASKVT